VLTAIVLLSGCVSAPKERTLSTQEIFEIEMEKGYTGTLYYWQLESKGANTSKNLEPLICEEGTFLMAASLEGFKKPKLKGFDPEAAPEGEYILLVLPSAKETEAAKTAMLGYPLETEVIIKRRKLNSGASFYVQHNWSESKSLKKCRTHLRRIMEQWAFSAAP